MIIGAHVMIQSGDDAADKAFLRDVLRFPNVDAGNGFLIFAVPSAEIAVHEGSADGHHELFLMCDDVEAFIDDMNDRDIACTPAQNQGWGIITQVTLPGGGKLGVYQPQHKRPKATAVRSGGASRTARKASKATSKRRPAAKRATRSAPKRAKRPRAKPRKR